MKKTFIAVVAAAACAASAFGQTSPAPAPAASGSTLTPEERQRAIAYLKDTEKDFLAAVGSVSEAQWKFKAAPDKWSIAETAEHIVTAEELIWGRVTETMKGPATPEKRAETQGKDDIILQKIPDRSRKAQAPEILQPTGKYPTREAIVKQFKEARAKEIAFLEGTKEDLRNHMEDHPFLKTMDAYQWLLFNGAHSKRHIAQIEEIKTDAKYPKG